MKRVAKFLTGFATSHGFPEQFFVGTDLIQTVFGRTGQSYQTKQQAD
jgi:hypothetical protein